MPIQEIDTIIIVSDYAKSMYQEHSWLGTRVPNCINRIYWEISTLLTHIINKIQHISALIEQHKQIKEKRHLQDICVSYHSSQIQNFH